MMMRKTKVAITTGVVILILAATALIWKRFSTPQLKDSDFFVGEKSPPNLVVIRPTHFAHRNAQIGGTSFKNAAGKEVRYIVGQNASFQEMMEAAYGNGGHIVSEARIVFPANMPTAKFDYLVTTPEKPEEHLQTAIKKKFGYVGRWETNNAEVFALKVETADASGLQISTNTVRKYNNGRFTHYKIGVLVGPLEYNFKRPVLDETGLTNFYDFYWNFGLDGKASLDRLLANLGLGLEPTNEPLQMLVVEKVR